MNFARLAFYGAEDLPLMSCGFDGWLKMQSPDERAKIAEQRLLFKWRTGDGFGHRDCENQS